MLIPPTSPDASAVRPPATARQVVAVMLAGTIQPSPLRQELDLSVLCLPMARVDGERTMRQRAVGTVLECWLGVLTASPQVESVRIVLNSRADVDRVNRELDHLQGIRLGKQAIKTIAEPASWRGAGGILRDVTGGIDEQAIVVVVEGHMLPPRDIRPLIEGMIHPGNGPVDGMVGTARAASTDRAFGSSAANETGEAMNSEGEPAGVYAFSRAALELIPHIGYYDLKEQFLPALHKQRLRVLTARLGERTIRLRDRMGYLSAVRSSLGAGQGIVSRWDVAETATVSQRAVLDGFCVICDGVVVDDRAVIHDSVVLPGARIEPGAVVSQSLIGPGVIVESNEHVVRQVRSIGPAPGRRSRRGLRMTTEVGRDAPRGRDNDSETN